MLYYSPWEKKNLLPIVLLQNKALDKNSVCFSIHVNLKKYLKI